MMISGSSIISVVDGRIKVGPESVGSAPGPACFGLGGREATMTDAFGALYAVLTPEQKAIADQNVGMMGRHGAGFRGGAG